MKIKNPKAFNPIPQRILIDGIEYQLTPITKLMGLMYRHKAVLHQWLVSNTIPAYKNKEKKVILKTIEQLFLYVDHQRSLKNYSSNESLKNKVPSTNIIGVNQHCYKKLPPLYQ
jgi:hypothetical protein